MCHTLNNDKSLRYHVHGNWSARAARNVLQHTNRYELEVWYAVNHLEKKKAYRKEGIVYKLYPASTLNKLLESFFGIIKSQELLDDLNLEDADNTIIHFQGERSSLLHAIIKKHPQFLYLLQYHGYGQQWWLNWVESIFLVPIEKKTFPIVSHFFVHIQRRIHYLIEKIHVPPSKISFQNVGVDFAKYRPRNKKRARKILGLPQDKFIILYVGRIVKTKGVDKLIAAYKILKKKYNNLYLLFIGGQQEDPMYEEARSEVHKIIKTIKNEDLPLYYNVSDVYCFYGDDKTIQYAGIGTAPTEALACNINVISTNLIHIPGYEKKKIGFIPRNFSDFISKLEYLILHPNFKFNPRKIVEPYTSYDYMTKNLIRTYEKLFSKKN